MNALLYCSQCGRITEHEEAGGVYWYWCGKCGAARPYQDDHTVNDWTWRAEKEGVALAIAERMRMGGEPWVFIRGYVAGLDRRHLDFHGRPISSDFRKEMAAWRHELMALAPRLLELMGCRVA